MRMTTASNTTRNETRTVRCPTCKGASVYANSNAYRPFCSERCRQIDLGAWASEQFALPTTTPAQPDPTQPQ